MTALEMAGVVAGYGDARVLDGVSLSVADGEMVCLIGPNGAGKSTCLKVVMGLLPWTEGEVRLGGVPVPSGGAPDGGRAALGYVPQVRNTFPSLSVRENLLVMTPRQWPRATAERRVGELLGVHLPVPRRQRRGVEARHHPPHVRRQQQGQRNHDAQQPLDEPQGLAHFGLLHWKTSSMRTPSASAMRNPSSSDGA